MTWANLHNNGSGHFGNKFSIFTEKIYFVYQKLRSRASDKGTIYDYMGKCMKLRQIRVQN